MAFSELQSVLRIQGTKNNGVRTEYSFPEAWQIPGDEYNPATIFDRVRGRAARLVHYHQPWRDDGKSLISGGYFYAPNCIAGWKPPR